MRLTEEQAGAIVGATWLFGLAALFYTRAWWPGIMFLVGISAIVEGFVHNRGWYAFQGGLWCIGIGVWAMYRFHIAVLFVILGISVLLGAFVRPPLATEKPAPYPDADLE